MLKILDKYIIQKYLSTFFFVVLIFTAIALALDFSDKVEDFIEEPVTKMQILREYMWGFALFINGRLWPIYAMITVIFFTSRLAYNSEIISILNAGVPFRRIAVPYLIAAGIVFSLHLIGNHFFIPWGNALKIKFENKYIYKNRDKGRKENVHLFLTSNVKGYIKYYRDSDSIARELRLERVENNQIVSILEATTAQWQGNIQKWRLYDYQVRTFQGTKEQLFLHTGENIDTTLNMRPADFIFYENGKEMLTSLELNRALSQEKQRGLFNTKAFEVELYRRTAQPFSILIFTILGLAVAGRKVRGGMGMHLVIGISAGAVFEFLSTFSATFATGQSMPSMLGVWIPNLFFMLVTAIAVSKAQQ
jgi:lipopolysaccharide export system permease protein